MMCDASTKELFIALLMRASRLLCLCDFCVVVSINCFMCLHYPLTSPPPQKIRRKEKQLFFSSNAFSNNMDKIIILTDE